MAKATGIVNARPLILVFPDPEALLYQALLLTHKAVDSNQDYKHLIEVYKI